MVAFQKLSVFVAFTLVEVTSRALAHSDDGVEVGAMTPARPTQPATTASSEMALANAIATPDASESYFSYPHFGSLMLAHIALMTIAWFFVLPIGVMLSVARSRLALVVQLSFLGLHGIALSLGTIYAYNTPQLYENNSHNKVGWIVSWIVAIQCVLEIVKLVARIGQTDDGDQEEQMSFLPVTTTALERHEQDHGAQPAEAHRYSDDSGNFTASQPSRTDSVSSTGTYTQEEEQKLHQYNAHGKRDSDDRLREKHGLLCSPITHRITTSFATALSSKALRVIDTITNAMNRTILPIGFVAFVTGAAVYGGVFRGIDIFNGLAHSIKGGIFFWYGLLTLGRWMGCFVEYGWAWNVRPPTGVVSSRKARIPSAEFIESFVIFLYGSTNVFLEHLAAWGKAWSPMDLEHISITIMFFGGGLCGMLVESTRVRELLNSAILTSPAAHGPRHVRDNLAPPKSYSAPMNPFPGLVILLLGLLMSSHHQHSQISTTIHQQWGTLFMGFALARGLTYIIMWIAPPSSYLPSRPPTELISSFCLISGGLIFMASNRNTVDSLEYYGIHAMFLFTVVVGFTSFLMAWAIIVMAVKGWAVRRNQPTATYTHPIPASGVL